VRGHRLYVRRKLKENNGNEENSGLIHKKAFEDKLVTFCQFSFGSLIILSLSLSHS